MATQGGPNEIGNVHVSISGNLEPLKADLEKAKQEAARAAQEIKDGSPSSTSTGPAQSTGDVAGAAAIGGATGAVTALALVNALSQAQGALKDVVASMVEMTRQQIELRNALAEYSQSVSQSVTAAIQTFEQRAGGNRNIGTGLTDRFKTLMDQKTQLESEIANPSEIDQLRDLVFDGSAMGTAEDAFIKKLNPQEQRRQSLQEIEKQLAVVRRAMSEIAKRERPDGTLEGVIEGSAAEQGVELPGGRIRPLGPISPAQSQILQQTFREDPELLREVVKYTGQTWRALEDIKVNMFNETDNRERMRP